MMPPDSASAIREIAPSESARRQSVQRQSVQRQSAYSLSFTALSLRPELARLVAETYLDTRNWPLAKGQVLANNILQSRSPKSAVRMEAELRQRLMTLSDAQLELLARGNLEDRAAMAWLGTCKHVALIHEFAIQVLRDKIAAHDPVLRPSDYESFLAAQALLHPQLSALTPQSKDKIRQVLFRMLVEAGLLLKTGGARTGSAKTSGAATIQRPVLSRAVQEAVKGDDARYLAVFLVPDAEIARG